MTQRPLKCEQPPTPFSILTHHAQVSRYVEEVKRAADKNRLALGFLPGSVYDEGATQGRLWVGASQAGAYLGHLLFGGTYPDLKVVQVFVDATQRRRGVASALVDELVRERKAPDVFFAS